MRNKTVVTVLSHIIVPMWVLLSYLVAPRALAQNGDQFKDWIPASDEVRRTPKITCEDLRRLTGYDFSVITANVIAATEGTPEHCRVSGQILPEIRFEVNLPASWNRRLYMFGNGGFAGEPFDADYRAASRDRALKYGFAVAATNTGHDANAEPLAIFATSRQKLVDYAFRAVHTTAETAKKLVRAYYGESQSRAYFDGCSTGGRQGLISAQRFPEDFDGIVVGAPVLPSRVPWFPTPRQSARWPRCAYPPPSSRLSPNTFMPGATKKTDSKTA